MENRGILPTGTSVKVFPGSSTSVNLISRNMFSCIQLPTDEAKPALFSAMLRAVPMRTFCA